MGRVRGIKTPRGEWVNYDYNTIGELTAVPGYVTNTSYNSRGMLETVTAAIGIVNSYGYDMNGRVTDLSYSNQSTTLKDYTLRYDSANNIVAKNDNGYNYDRLNQLVFANLKGKFELTSDVEKDDQYTGRTIDDYDGQEAINEVEDSEIIELDYAAGSVGVDLGGTYPVTIVELSPDSPLHRVEERDLAVYYSTNSYEYKEITGFELTKDEDGKIWINLDEAVEARYIKVKTYYDDRDDNFEPVNNAEFTNIAEDIIKVYYYVTERLEQYDYDASGNRVSSTISDRYTDTKTYSYYSTSNRLKSNGKYAYLYDDNGNLIEKGTSYTISGDSVTINPEGEEYWEYEYDLLDRLISVRNNGVAVANYSYNHKGLRLKKENYDTTIYYVFNLNDNIVYEQENGEYSEYIYVGRQHFARVDGDISSVDITTYFYHTDHLGSTVLVTNAFADIVWSSEYTPFGSLAMEEGEFGFQKAKKFTGKDLDEDTGLYYYNARWYDAEIGRFTSADSYKGELANPHSLNVYIYTANNPLIYVDPTGHNNNYYRGLAYDYWYGTDNPTPEGFGEYIEINKGEDLSRYANNFLVGAGNTILDTINPLTYYNLGKFALTYAAADPMQKLQISNNITLNMRNSIIAFRNMSKENQENLLMQFMGGATADYMLGLGLSKGISKLNDVSWMDDLNGFSNYVDGASGNDVFDDIAKGTGKADFYVKPNGEAVPATGYRYMDSKYATQTMKTQSAPGSYFGFEKYDSAADAQNAFQIAPEWSNCKMLGEFDTLQVIDDIYVPTTMGNTTNIPEPFTVSYPQYGTGETYQLKVDSTINFRNITIIGD